MFINNNNFFNLAPNVPLTPNECTVLGLGLKHIPLNNFNRYECRKSGLKSITQYIRRLKLSIHFTLHPSHSELNPIIPPIDHPLSRWTPINNTEYIHMLDTYHTNCIDKFLTSLKHIKTTPNKKLPTCILSTYKKLGSRKDIIIKPADKNLGLCVLTPSLYNDLCMKHLNDTTTYKYIDPATYFHNMHKPFAKLRHILSTYKRLYLPSTNNKPPTLTPLASSLLQLQHSTNNSNTPNLYLRIPSFYILPKMHKPILSGRPIVSCILSTTYHASLYLDKLFQPIRRLLPCVCLRSTDVILDLNLLQLPSNTVITCADVSSLYPNIPISYGLNAVKNILYKYVNHPSINFTSIQIPFILQLLQWVLENNYIQYKNNIYLQIDGTAMGTPVAVCYADMVLSFLETSCLSLNIIYYRRYIDDLFLISSPSTATLFVSIFNSQCKSIKLDDVTTGVKGIFLDLCIMIKNNACITSIFQKPINTYMYLTPYSTHNKKILINFIKSELKRYCITCTIHSDFINISNLFYSRLLNRGYSENFLKPIFSSPLSRISLLKNLYTNLITSKQKATKFPPLLFISDNTHAKPHNKISWHKILALPPSLTQTSFFQQTFPSTKLTIAHRNPPSASFYLTTKELSYPKGYSNKDFRNKTT